MTPRASRRSRMIVIVAALMLFATACGGGGSAADPAAVSEADANLAQLQLDGDIASTQLLNAATGEISSLGDVVTGDRAVLVWYWAPH